MPNGKLDDNQQKKMNKIINMNKIKITLGNYTYGIRKTTKGKFYIIRSFSHNGFVKWQKGLLENGSGIIQF